MQWNTRIITAVITAIGALALLAMSPPARSESIRLAQGGDVRQEDRRADRREDRRDDRQADRRNDDAKEARVALPRNADGTIDFAALFASIDARVDAGAREIQIRRDSLTQDETRALLLTSEGRDLLAQIGAALPGDGRERHVTFRGTVDARVQRQPDGSLRLIVRDIDLANLTAAEREQLARDLSMAGFDRVRIRSVDGKRIEFRADERAKQERDRKRDHARNDDKREHAGHDRDDERKHAKHAREDRDRVHRGDRADHADRFDRADRGDRAEHGDRIERSARVERVDRADRSGPSDRVERVERTDRSGPSDRVERVERSGSGNSGRH
jgi:hypothetical protein